MIENDDKKDFFSYFGLIAFGNAMFEVPLLSDIDIEKCGQGYSMSIKRVPNPYAIKKCTLIDFSGTERQTSNFPMVFGFDKMIPVDELSGVDLNQIDKNIAELDLNAKIMNG